MIERVTKTLSGELLRRGFMTQIEDGVRLKPDIEAMARAAIEAIGPELRAAITYFEGYCQDEAEDEDNCLAGTNQHRDAVAFAEAVKALRASLQGDER